MRLEYNENQEKELRITEIVAILKMNCMKTSRRTLV